MSVDYTTTALIASVKRRAMVPSSQSVFETLDFCGLLTDEMQSLIVPIIMELNAHYFLGQSDQALDPTKTTYYLPSRTINGKVKSVELYQPENKIYWRPIQVENGQWGFQSLSNLTQSFVIQDDQVIFNVAPAETNQILRIFYWRRPSNLVPVTNAARITSVEFDTSTITVDTNPGWTLSTTFDLIQGYGQFRALGDDIGASVVMGLTITLDRLPTDLQVGDWISESGTSPIAQMPYECHHVLCQAVAVKILESMGDANMIAFAQKKLEELIVHMQSVMKKRVDEQPIRITNANSILNSVRARNGYYWV